MAEALRPAAYFRLIPVPSARPSLTALSAAYAMEPRERKKHLLENLVQSLLFMMANIIYLVKTVLNL